MTRTLLFSTMVLLGGCGALDGLFGDDGSPQDRRPVVPVDQTAAEARVVELVNAARAEARSCGPGGEFAPAPPLLAEGLLGRAARGHSTDMAQNDYFDHTALDGSAPWDRVQREGYDFRFVGENIAAGLASPDETVAGWLDSPGHCANIMNPDFTETGVGVAEGGSFRVYWTQVFARPL